MPGDALAKKIYSLFGGGPNDESLYVKGLVCKDGFAYDGVVLPKNLYDSDSLELFINTESEWYPLVIGENKTFSDNSQIMQQKAMMMHQSSTENMLRALYGKFFDKPEPKPYLFLDYLINPGFEDVKKRDDTVDCGVLYDGLTALFVIDFKYASQPNCSNPAETLYKMFKNVIQMNLEVRYVNTISVDTDPTSQERFYKKPDFIINIPFTIIKTPDDPETGYKNTPSLSPLKNTLVKYYDLEYKFNSSKGKTTKILIASFNSKQLFCNQSLSTLIENNKKKFSERLVYESFFIDKMNWIKDIFSQFGTYNIKFYESDQNRKYFDVGDPGIDPSGGDFNQSCGGGGGGSVSNINFNPPESSISWYPQNSSDLDFISLNPHASSNVYSYGQGGSPYINGIGEYNPTGTSGLAIVSFYFPNYTGVNDFSIVYTRKGNALTYKTDWITLGKNLKPYSELTIYRDAPNAVIESPVTFEPYQTGATTGTLSGYSVYMFSTGIYEYLFNHNYLIKDNYYHPLTNEYKILLDRYIDTNVLVEGFFYSTNNSYVSSFFFSSNISSTDTTSAITYVGDDSQITVDISTDPLDVTNTYYVLAPTSTGSMDIIVVTDFQIDSSGRTVLSLTGGHISQDAGPFAYVASYNTSATYSLQFLPSSIYKAVFYNVTLLSLSIPNRSILTSYNKGIRYLSDYPYFFLQVWNSKDDGLPDTQVINNIYVNNPNGPPNGAIPPIFSNESLFKIDTVGAGESEDNFLFYSTPSTARVKFSPGYFNIRLRLIDRYGNIIRFDNTPVKRSDQVFLPGVVPADLLSVVATFLFQKL